ncbi:MAG: cysteine--tRNA ligase [Dehalococcoidales bacterium]|nr:cysteine--tRNA ligase [Dehalococcoidales bacterium]
MRIYNTRSGQLEEFTPIGDEVRMYVCGITPYDTAHVGHAMSYLVFDAIRRYLEYTGHKVKHVQNFTDIDDKIIDRANRLGITTKELAEKYIAEFMADMALLNVEPAHVYPRATEEIGPIIQIIEGLIEKGHAYVADGDVYFRVSSLPDYGKLSHRSLDEMRAGARVEVGEQKESPMDFTLWKASKPGEPAWESPWGPGRPGWHIECSAMSLRYLGEQIDIHGGGQDLIFPHHENEIAQSEGYTGKKPFVRYWMHNGLLQLGGEKMSKSIGNLVTIRDAVSEHGADALRLFVLTSHYRSPLTYTATSLDAAAKGVERMRAARMLAAPAEGTANAEATRSLAEATAKARLSFTVAMEDDFNTPAAIAALFDLVRDINRSREQGASGEALAQAQHTLGELAHVLGFTMAEEKQEEEVAAQPFIELLISVRRDLRAARQWALADKIRDHLADLGVIVEDRPEGSTWKLKK